MYDIAIIGSGPAGLSSAIEAKIRNKNIIVFGIKELSNKVALAPSIENYLGIPNTNGKSIIDNFRNHMETLDIKITEERINAVYSMGEYFALSSGDKMYESKTVILATGVEFTRPLKGEVELLGRGVGYCASCDGMLYKNKEVVVIGRSNIVGKPVAALMLERNCTVTVCHSKTKDLQSVCQRADILIVAIGIPNYIDSSYVKEGAIVIDVGTSSLNGKITGDVLLDDVIGKSSYMTKVPGGVGALTTTLLMKNVCEALK